jgi:hypothetical protein
MVQKSRSQWSVVVGCGVALLLGCGGLSAQAANVSIVSKAVNCRRMGTAYVAVRSEPAGEQRAQDALREQAVAKGADTIVLWTVDDSTPPDYGPNDYIKRRGRIIRRFPGKMRVAAMLYACRPRSDGV